jgi:RNA polymerase sigma-70 factor (sigma-E family)
MRDEPADFAAFVTARYAYLVRAACLAGCSGADAEDAVQHALVITYQRWGRVQRQGDPAPYVFRILFNHVRRSRRRFWHREHPTDILPDKAAADLTDAWDTAHALSCALRDLPVDQRSVLVLRYYSDLTERQTAEVLGIPSGTVKSRAARALTALAANPALRSLATPRGDIDDRGQNHG